MKLTHTFLADQNIVAVEGKIDTLNAAEFEKYILPYTESEGFNLVLDCSNLAYISSAGLRVLLVNAKKAKAMSGQFYLKNLNASVKQVLDITGFTPLFNLL